MRACVTGGAGFIGSHVVRLLVETGWDVVVLDNLYSGHRRNLEPYPQIRLILGDVRHPAAIDRAFAGVDAVFHLAASVGNARSIEHPIHDSDVNVLGTLQVLEGARRHGVRRLIFSSSAAVYGELRTLPIAEDHPTEPDTPYGASKLAAEKLCLAYAKVHGLQVVCLRYFNVYGTNQRYDPYGNVLPVFARQVSLGEPLTVFGDGEQTRDLVNAQDVAQANVKACLAEGVVGVYNIGSGRRVTINHLAALLTGLSSRQAMTRHGPPRSGDVRHSLADISAARRDLQYVPSVGLERGLADYLSWLRKEMAAPCVS
ncbi:MAG: NAD-dependent epimerase/dehydratase family protein [Anaerolineae bacterium]